MLNRKVRDLVDSKSRFKAIVFNLQDRLLQKGMSSLQEIMLAYVKEVALPHLRRISEQQKTAVVITANLRTQIAFRKGHRMLADSLVGVQSVDREIARAHL